MIQSENEGRPRTLFVIDIGEETDARQHPVIASDELARLCAKSLDVGQTVDVQAELVTHVEASADGATVYVIEIVAQGVTIITRREDGGIHRMSSQRLVGRAEEPPCACEGRGWLSMRYSENETEEPHIERCDTCAIFETDEDAEVAANRAA